MSTHNSFSTLDGKQARFACYSEDNRLKVWDTSNSSLKQQCVAADHLSAKYTSLHWCTPSSVKQKDKLGKKTAGFLALGTTQGKIVIWNINSGEVQCELFSKTGEAHRSGSQINDVKFNNTGSLLWSAGADGMICEWDVGTGKLRSKWKGDSQEVRRLCSVSKNGSDSHLLSGRCHLKLWDLSTKKSVCKYSGHDTPISDIVVSSCSSYCVTCSATDRYVNLWDLTQATSQPLAVFVAKENIVSLSFRAIALAPKTPKKKKSKTPSSPGFEYEVLGLSSTGAGAYIWAGKSGDLEENMESICRIKLSKKDAKKATTGGPVILHCAFSRNDSDSVLVACGHRVNPFFRVAKIRNEEGEFENVTLSSLVAETASTKDVSKKVSEEGDDDENVEMKNAIVRPSASKTMKVTATDRDQEEELAKSGMNGSSSSSSGTVSAQVIDTRSFIEKLDAIDSHLAKQSGMRRKKSNSNTPKAESLQVVIEQALHSNDVALLESSLEVTQPSVVQATVQRMSTPNIIPFLNSLIVRFESNPNRAQRLIPWIRAVLVYHSTYLMTVTDIEDSLASLFDIIEQRLQSYDKLLQLSGRFEVILSQLKFRKQNARQGAAVSQSQTKTLMVIDSDIEEDALEEMVNDVESSGESEDSDDASEEAIYITPEQSEDEEEGEEGSSEEEESSDEDDE